MKLSSVIKSYITSFVAQLVKNPPAMRETWVWCLSWEDPLAKLPTPVFWPGESHGLSPWGCKELDTTEWPSLSQPSIKIKLHGETEWKYQLKKETRQEWRVLLPAPPSLSSREHQFLQFTEQVLCCFQPSSHPHVEGIGVSWKSEVYKVYVIRSGGFQVPRNWAGYLGPPGGWNPPVGLELAADRPGYMRWRREKGCWGPGDSIRGLIPVCWALGSSRRKWGASYRTPPPPGTRTERKGCWAAYRGQQRHLPAGQPPLTVQLRRQDAQDHHLHGVGHLQGASKHVRPGCCPGRGTAGPSLKILMVTYCRRKEFKPWSLWPQKIKTDNLKCHKSTAPSECVEKSL